MLLVFRYDADLSACSPGLSACVVVGSVGLSVYSTGLLDMFLICQYAVLACWYVVLVCQYAVLVSPSLSFNHKTFFFQTFFALAFRSQTTLYTVVPSPLQKKKFAFFLILW